MDKTCHAFGDKYIKDLREETLGMIRGVFKPKQPATQDAAAGGSGTRTDVFTSQQTATHDRILSGVRRIVEGHNRYTPGSVPFEIFQNADDAATDRKLSDPDTRFSFDVFTEPGYLVFRHFGRCVNQFLPTAAGRSPQQGMADDLSGMLNLGLSTKLATDTDQTLCHRPRYTGKFGLGFKSVFLISKRPKLLSGELACEIVAGVYPIPLLGPKREAEFGPYLPQDKLRHQTTVLKLPLDVNLPDNNILDDFQRLAHIQVVFGREIHQITFRGNANPTTVRWNPTELLRGVWHGDLADSLESSTQQSRRAIVFQVFCEVESERQFGEMLLRYGDQGFLPLPDDVPTIWVTAPVQETNKLKVGFAINSDFQLDPGRSNLAWGGKRNLELAAQLGEGLSARFSDLFERSQTETDWAALCKALRLSSPLTIYQFWKSLWSLFTDQVEKLANDEGHSPDRLVRRFLWDPDSGLATRFYRQHAALPNCLPDGFQKLIKATDIKFAAVGVLLNAKVLGIVKSWPSMRHDPDRDDSPNLCDVLVAKDMVAKRLGELAPTITKKPTDLTLAGLFERERNFKGCLSSDRAELLASLLFAPPLTGVDGKDKHPQEWPDIESALRRFLFLDAANNPQLASNLLIPINSEKSADGDGSEEEMIAAFAPGDRVLSSAYQGDSLRLFKLCRASRKTVTEGEVAYWAANARGAQQKDAVIHYLSRGRLRESVIEVLKSQGFCWITPFLSSFKDADSQEREAKQVLRNYERSEAIKTDLASALQRILDWWTRDRNQRRHEFKGLILNDTEQAVFFDEYDPHNIEHRKAWLRVFILAMSHTKGLKQTWHKRAFLEFCEQRRWLETFAKSDSEPDDWLGILDGYFDQTWENAQYYDWLGLFPGIYAIAQRLDSYVYAFHKIKQRNERFLLRDITRPQHPIPAPDISRVLGMGANFIIREMLRTGAIKNPAESPAAEHAFVPTTRFQSTLKLLHCDLNVHRDYQSSQAFRFLKNHLGAEAATFGGDFDIPFQVLAGDQQLQNDLLDALIPEDEDSDE